MAREFVGFTSILSVLFICLALSVIFGCSGEQPSQPVQATSASSSQSPPQSTTAPPASTPGPTSLGPKNIAQIQVGMSSQQALEIMGKPDRIKQEGRHTEWEYFTPQGKCEIKLQNDRVVSVERH